MEENVALDSKKQKKFEKSIKGIKKLLKKNEGKPHKPAVLAPKDSEGKVDKKKRKRKERGLVYLSHIPHGFYEHEMTQYFKQFGMVTNVRVIRSPRTGRSKGFAFVEFREPAVAEIVAETMNNYLMGKRLIKAAIIPPEKQRHRAMRKHWTTLNNPTAERRKKMKKEFNSNKDEAGNLEKALKLLKTFEQKKEKLSELGINIDFVTPVDIPEALKEHVQGTAKASGKTDEVKVEDVKQKKGKSKGTEAGENFNKKEKKKETKQPKTTEVKVNKEVANVAESDKSKAQKKMKDVESDKSKTQKKMKDAESDKSKAQKKMKDAESNTSKAQKKMKDAGVKPPENFIKILEESGEESDSSVEFDSDEYEKMLENDSGASGDESEDEDGDEEDEVNDDDENSEEDLPPLIPIKGKKAKKPVVAAPPQSKKGAKPINVQKPQKNIQIQQQKKPQQQALKRKNPEPEVSPKKPKFEKNDKKQRNKQFKKKNKAH